MDDFTRAFIEAMLWASTADDDGNSYEYLNYDADDLAPASLQQIIDECRAFQMEHAELLSRAGSAAQNGHDFLLTRDGHGAGFWDRGYGAVGDQLTEACKPYGEVNLYVGDDEQLYVS